MRKGTWRWALLALLAAAGMVQVSTAGARMIGINVVLNTDITGYEISVLGTIGKVRDIVPEIKAAMVQAPETELAAIQALPFVLAANPDAERSGSPIDTVPVTDFSAGYGTWDLDTWPFWTRACSIPGGSISRRSASPRNTPSASAAAAWTGAKSPSNPTNGSTI
jgi:hypothetical protein